MLFFGKLTIFLFFAKNLGVFGKIPNGSIFGIWIEIIYLFSFGDILKFNILSFFLV